MFNYVTWLASLFVMVVALSAAGAPPERWESRGPGGGGAMYAPAINPHDPDEFYAGCDMSPQFHSRDGGRSWSALDFRSLQGGHESTVRFTRDPLLRWCIDYAPIDGGDNARPVRSRDGGKTWQRLPDAVWPAGRKAYRLMVDFDRPERVLVAADYRDLWVSLDGGETFEKKLTAANRDAGFHLAGAFFDGDTIYLGAGEGLFVSQDGGRSFARSTVPGLPPGEFISCFAGGKSDGTVRLFCVTLKGGWAGITGGECGEFRGIHVLTMGQGGWRKTGTGISPAARPFFVGMAANDADSAYVAGGGTRGAPAVYKTTDGGRTWNDVFLTAGNAHIAIGWAGDGAPFRWSFPEYALGFEVCRSDKNALAMTDLGCIHVSSDGGQSWRQAYNSPTARRSFASAGIEVTTAWRVAWFSPTELFSCFTDIRGARSGDGGRSWSFDYKGHDQNTMYHAVKHPRTGICYAATSSVHDLYMSTYLEDRRIDGGKGRVLLSRDDGRNWSVLRDFGRPVIWLALDPSRPNRLYVAVVHSREGGLWRTDELDRGPAATWQRLTAPPRTEGHPYNVLVLKDGALVCTYSGRRAGGVFTPSSGVFLSLDGGQTWEDRTDPRMRFWTKDVVPDLSDTDQNTWYAGVFHAWGRGAADGRSGLYRTRDRGRTWTLLADNTLSPTGVLNVESCAFDPSHPGEFYFTTEYDGLWHTQDIRAERPAFRPVASYPFRHPLRVQFNPHQPSEVWVTSFGNGLKVGVSAP